MARLPPQPFQYQHAEPPGQDPTLFAPPAATLNVSQWVSVAKSMGARVAALTSKHEKGFCLWPSKYSNFTIAHRSVRTTRGVADSLGFLGFRF